MLAKVASLQESYRSAAGLYVVLFFVTFFPASILAGLAAPAIWAICGARRRRVSSWLGWCRRGSCLEAVITKLPHYVLPLYPAIAILTAGAIESRVAHRSGRGSSAASAWCSLVPVISSASS